MGSFCDFCKSAKVDNLNLGEIIEYKGFHAHYYCLVSKTLDKN